MALRFEGKFDEYAYRIADAFIADSVSTVEEGQWVTFNSEGKLVVSTGAAGVKSFLVIGSKRTGRNQVGGVPVKKISFLHGPFRVVTDQYDDTQTYTGAMVPLKVNGDGLLTPWASATDSAQLIVAYSKGAPTSDGWLEIYSA